ncbi:hypothetical protein NDU88_002236 [Pleurodeles waltl]|uniref:Uncharacterized protein n=1 Tax=Pleurodeles waltl TaxID=8319 RepID=A0AAV7UXT4_PLEWA|nr:hypothetical protein NDU88_002236 [Pleurodeles waltl]
MRKITHRELQIRKCGPWYGAKEGQDSSARHAKAPIGRKEPPALRERGSRQEESAPCIRNRWPRTGSDQGQIPVGASRNVGWGPLNKRLLPSRNQNRDRLLPKLSQRWRAGGSSRVGAGDGERVAPLELGPELWLRRSGDPVLNLSRTGRRGQLAGGNRDVAGNPGMRIWVLGGLNAGSEGSLPVGPARRRSPGRQPIHDPRRVGRVQRRSSEGATEGKKDRDFHRK